MKASSCKAKGRKLQQIVRDKVLKAFPELTPRDVQSTAMGQSGVDVKLSAAAFKVWPYAVECKNLAKIAVYKYFNQRQGQEGETLLVVKQNSSPPLAIITLDHFMELVKCQKK